MHVGDPVAMVVAESYAAAQDAADLVQVEYEELPAVVDLDTAMKGRNAIVSGRARQSLCRLAGHGPERRERARGRGDHRQGAARGARARRQPAHGGGLAWKRAAPPALYDTANDSYTLHACSQSADALRGQAASIMGVPNDKLRVITEDVGGAFGMKTTGLSGIFGAAGGGTQSRPAGALASRRVRKPSSPTRRRATPSPRPNSRSTTRASFSRCACAICATRAPMWPMPASASTPTISRAACPACTASRRSMCRSPAISATRVPIGPYRGAGRPEANYVLERVVEEAARITGIDPVRLRKKNLIPPSAMPYKTAIGNTYDSGDFPGIVDKALELADYDNFNKRKRESAQRKKFRGIGISCMLEHAGAHADGTSLGRVSRRRQADSRLQCAVDRPGPRHGVRPPAREQAWHRRRQDRAPAWRHRVGTDRLRLGRLALGHVRRQRHRAHGRRDARQGQEGRVRCCWKRPRAISSIAMAIQGGRHRPQDFAVRDRAPRQGDWAKASTPRTRPRRR